MGSILAIIAITVIIGFGIAIALQPSTSQTAGVKVAISIHEERVLKNIADIYRSVYPSTAAGYVQTIDCTGVTEFRTIAYWEKVGQGTQSVRFVNFDNRTQVLHEYSNLTTGAHDIQVWQPLPSWCVGEERIVVEAKSTNTRDDPIAHGFVLLLR